MHDYKRVMKGFGCHDYKKVMKGLGCMIIKGL